MPNTQIADVLRSHPALAIAGIVVATVTFWEQFIVPIHTRSLRNQIESNAELVEKARATQDGTAALARKHDGRVRSLERQLNDALAKVAALEHPNMFSVGNPYPMGLDW